MLRFRFSRLPKHRSYSYEPIYYNEEKEKLHAHVKAIKREMGETDGDSHSIEDSKANIRSAFRKVEKDRRKPNPLARFYGLRIILIAGLLGLIFFKLLKSPVFETFIEGLSK